MRKFSLIALALAMVFIATSVASAQCAKIKDGSIVDSAGNLVTLGSDQYGYNYQARLFNGTYDSSDRNNDGTYFGATGDYTDDSLIMKWSDDWLSNMDCNGDHKLDRGGAAGANVNISKGWLTNQIEGDYLGGDGDSHHYTYFAKFIYVGPVPSGDDPWAGKRIWGEYAIIEEVYNDPYGGYHGVDRSKLARPAGFGFYTN